MDGTRKCLLSPSHGKSLGLFCRRYRRLFPPANLFRHQDCGVQDRCRTRYLEPYTVWLARAEEILGLQERRLVDASLQSFGLCDITVWDFPGWRYGCGFRQESSDKPGNVFERIRRGMRGSDPSHSAVSCHQNDPRRGCSLSRNRVLARLAPPREFHRGVEEAAGANSPENRRGLP